MSLLLSLSLLYPYPGYITTAWVASLQFTFLNTVKNLVKQHDFVSYLGFFLWESSTVHRTLVCSYPLWFLCKDIIHSTLWSFFCSAFYLRNRICADIRPLVCWVTETQFLFHQFPRKLHVIIFHKTVFSVFLMKYLQEICCPKVICRYEYIVWDLATSMSYLAWLLY